MLLGRQSLLVRLFASSRSGRRPSPASGWEGFRKTYNHIIMARIGDDLRTSRLSRSEVS